MNPLLLLLVSALSAVAAVITGNVKDTRLAPAATNVTFTPLSTPLASAPSVIFSAVQSATSDTNGDFALTLAPGNYKVTIGSNANDSFLISVPDGAVTNTWTDLATGTLTYSYPFSPAYVDRIIATTRGDLFVFDGANVVRLGAGLAGQFLGSDATAACGLRWAVPASPWVQAVLGEYNTFTTSTATIPADDTPPQATEGCQTVTATITPRCATNYLYLQFTGSVCSSGTLLVTAALFRDAETTALAATGDTLYAAHTRTLSLAARLPCGSTNAQTFKIRVGPANTGTLYINGNASGRLYGGLAAHRLLIYEAQ